MAEAGRKTDLNKELLSKIKRSILDGNTLKETANICEIPESTLYGWSSDNYLNLADKIEGWKRDRKLMLAENNLESILTLGVSDKDSLKTVADISKFVSETLGKKNYSKQTNTDITTGGKPLPLLSGIKDEISTNNSTQEDISNGQEAQDNTGR